ncbi:hypothetical protein FRC11_009185, partial [Ceratobasidium sp. 423]
MHAIIPTHHFQRWNGRFYEAQSAQDIGYVLNLGHAGQPCTLGHESDLILGNTSGIYIIKVKYCRHKGTPVPYKQLLAARIFPCSEDRPSTGFTFNVLSMFRLFASEAKLSMQRFYNVLACLTNSMDPESIPDRYREFLRVSRAFDFLTDLYTSGAKDTKAKPSTDGDLALRCPVCPRLDVNFISSDVNNSN